MSFSVKGFGGSCKVCHNKRIEYYQNQFTKELGDWFKIGVQFYFVGYDQTNGFYPYILLDWTQTTIATMKKKIIWEHNVNKDGHALASFMYTKMNRIPSNCIIGLETLQFIKSLD